MVSKVWLMFHANIYAELAVATQNRRP